MSSNAKQVLMWVGGAVLFLGLVIGISVATTSNQPGSPSQGGSQEKPGVGEWTKGSRDAKVQLIEYSDFECPACATYYPILKKVASEFGDKIGVTYRHFPLDRHKNARSAAWAAEAAGKQGKFWEMHDILFEKQSIWANELDAFNTFLGYAKDLGLDEAKFRADYNSSDVRAQVDADYRSGMQAQVNATPTFILNGKPMEPPRGYEGLKKEIEQALNQ